MAKTTNTVMPDTDPASPSADQWQLLNRNGAECCVYNGHLARDTVQRTACPLIRLKLREKRTSHSPEEAPNQNRSGRLRSLAWVRILCKLNIPGVPLLR